MLRYILQRVSLMFIALFLVLLFTFFLIYTVPGGPFSGPEVDQVIRLAMERRFGLDRPIIVQFWYYITGVFRLDFGMSLLVQPQREVFDIITERFPITIALNLLSTFVALPLGFLFGIIAALNRNNFIDHAVSILVVVFISVPGFVMASFMQYFLAFRLGWFPITFSTSQFWGWERFYSMILPVLAASFGGIASITRFLRAELTEVLNSDYMLLAKTKGLRQYQAVIRHAIRNSLIPIMGTVVGMFVLILGGSVVLEDIFAIPGLGRISVNATMSQDYPLILAFVFMYTAVSLIFRLLVDLSWGIVDPRIVVGGGRNATR